MFGAVAKPIVLWLDARITLIWADVIRRKDVFIHGEFTYWGFLKNNVHLFLGLGLFGALTGYLNNFIEREVPFNAYAGKLGINQAPLSIIQATMAGRNPLSTPFPPADLVFGITCSLLLFVILAGAILWAAFNHTDSDRRASSEFHVLARVSFVTLFGSLMLVFLSYLIRNYGLLFQALAEIASVFAAVYAIATVLKRSRHPGLWLTGFILLGAADFLLQIYLPVISIFLVATGLASLVIAALLVPLLIVKKVAQHVKERHL